MKVRRICTKLFNKIRLRFNKTAYRLCYSRNDRCASNQSGGASLLDIGTVGSTPAAVNLIHILNEIGDRKLSGRTCDYLSNQFALIKSLKDVRTGSHRASMAKLIKNTWPNDLLDVPLVIKSHCMTVLHSKMRQEMGKYKPPNLKSWQRDYLIDGESENP